MYHPGLQKHMARAHSEELLREAEQQRLLQQLPGRHPHLMQVMIAWWNAFLAALPRSVRQVELHMPPTTGKL
jgi:hypothetical protein